MSDWKEYRIEDIAFNSPHAMATGPFGSAISSKFFQDEGVPVIRGGNLSTNVTERMSDEGLVFVSREKAREFKRSLVRKGDLIFTCWGTINQVGLITEDLKYPEYIISNKQMKLTVDPKKADPLYLYYLFSSPLKQAEILNNGIGAAVPGFNLGQLKSHIVRLPPVELQKKISALLNSFDRKISLNRQTNQTLEQIAQALFKSWFVNFEPTRAKIAANQAAQLRQQGQSDSEILSKIQQDPRWSSAQVAIIAQGNPEQAAIAALNGGQAFDTLSEAQQAKLKSTAALFADTLVDSELGAVPNGWQIKQVGDVVERLKPSKRYTKKQVKPFGLIPVYEQGTSILLGYHNDEPGFRATTEEPLFIFGDHTCVIHLSCENFDISQNVIPLSGFEYPTIWVYYAIQGKQNFQEYRRHWSEFVIKNVVCPEKSLAKVFSDTVTTLYKKKEQSVRENKELEQVRDALLPRLLSGLIEIDEIA
ncbi:restriction endonuclease subunit S [Microbulbifer sp. VTAC004]|uniref:restriction endonuclease subunit S n=1 Tax=Microbulbifer sp. VTAC004 TaxID=3243386 RepID=UPI004039F724